MRTDDLRSFLVVAELGNLRRGAERLGVSQSALSKALARLEAEVGLQLFERTSRGVHLTEAGKTMHEHASQMHMMMSNLESAMHDQRLARSGAVRLGVLPMLAAPLVPVLATFLAQRPLARVSLEANLSAHLIGMLQAGNIDLVLAALPANVPPDIESVPVGLLTLLIVARADHPRRHRFRELADLIDEQWLLPSGDHYQRKWLEQRFAEAGLPPPRVAVESHTSLILLSDLVRETDLLGVLPPHLLRQPGRGELVAVTGDKLHWQHGLALCWRRGAYQSPLCRDLRDTMIDCWRDIDIWS